MIIYEATVQGGVNGNPLSAYLRIDLVTSAPKGIDMEWYYSFGPRAKAHIWNDDRGKTLCGLKDITFDMPYPDDIDARCKTCSKILYMHFNSANISKPVGV